LRGKAPLLFLSWEIFGYLFALSTPFKLLTWMHWVLKLSQLKVPEFYLLFCSRGHVFNTALNAALNQSEVTDEIHLSFQAAHSHQRQRDRRTRHSNSFPRVSKYSAWRALWLDLQPTTLDPSIFEELAPVGRTLIGAVCEGLSPMDGTPCWSSGNR